MPAAGLLAMKTPCLLALIVFNPHPVYLHSPRFGGSSTPFIRNIGPFVAIPTLTDFLALHSTLWLPYVCNMKIENTKAQLRKGALELVVLSIIQKEEEAYPTDIINSLKKAKLIVVEGTLYPLLSRLKNGGLLKYTWRESQAGPPRKYYGLTESGEAFLTELHSSWRDLVEAVDTTTKSLSYHE